MTKRSQRSFFIEAKAKKGKREQRRIYRGINTGGGWIAFTKTDNGSRIYGWRKQTVERSFAKAKVNHGLCDARMLGIRNMRKQCFLTAAVQNVKRLVAPLLFPQTPASSAITYVKKRPFAHPRRNPGLQFMAAEVVFHPAAAHRSRRSLVARDFVFKPLMCRHITTPSSEGLLRLQSMAAGVRFASASAHKSRRSLVARDFLFHYEIAGPGILPLCKFCKPFARTLSAPPISMGRNPTGLQNQFKGFRPQ